MLLKCTIIGKPNWIKGRKILESIVSKDISAGKIVEIDRKEEVS